MQPPELGEESPEAKSPQTKQLNRACAHSQGKCVYYFVNPLPVLLNQETKSCCQSLEDLEKWPKEKRIVRRISRFFFHIRKGFTHSQHQNQCFRLPPSVDDCIKDTGLRTHSLSATEPMLQATSNCR